MKHRIELGKIDYNSSGRKNCMVDLEWELENGKFSMSGHIWNPSHTDCYTCGQCVDDIASYFKSNKKVQRMKEIWERWHLNDMHADCEHQRKLWDKTKQIVMITYKLKYEYLKEQNDIANISLEKLKRGCEVVLTPYEQFISSLPYHFKKGIDIPREQIEIDYYEEESRETKCVGWIKPEEHPEGLLTKPCPVCGYQYGTSWLKEEIPQDVINEIESWEVI